MSFLLYIIINNLFNFLQILIMIRVILSWISYNSYNGFIKILFHITDVVLDPIREVIPSQMGGVDFSPMVAFIILGFLKNFLLSVI